MATRGAREGTDYAVSPLYLLPHIVYRRFQRQDELSKAGDVTVAERAEKLIFKGCHYFPDPCDDQLSIRRQAEQFRSPVRTVFRSLDQPLGDKGIKEADQGRPLDADGCRQVFLANAVAKEVEVQEGAPGGIRQAGSLKFTVQGLAPAPCQESKVVEEVAAVNFSVGYIHPQ